MTDRLELCIAVDLSGGQVGSQSTSAALIVSKWSGLPSIRHARQGTSTVPGIGLLVVSPCWLRSTGGDSRQTRQS